MTKSLHTPEYEHFRLLMVAARERVAMTQADVALRLGRPQSFISKYESGERRLDVVEFVKICLVLRVDPLEIIAKVQVNVELFPSK
jgi:transcriptional regulator with XRE-family HTH domain